MKHAFQLSALIVAALSFGATEANAQAKEVKFGCYAPLTGQLAIFGKSMQSGFEMAIDEFQKSPQANGIKFSIQCEDDQGRADDGINIARKFIEDKSVQAVIGSWSSTVTLAAGPIYNQAKLVNITPISSHPDVTKVGPYVFRQSLVQSQEGTFNGAALQKLGARKIAMLGIPNDYGNANISLTKRAFEATGGKVVFEEFVRPDAQDFRQALQKAVRENPDWIYIGAFAPQTALMLKQLRQMGIKTPVYVCAADDTPDLARLAGADAIEGTHVTVQTNPVLGPELTDFYKRYSARYSRLPDPFASNSYNTAMMMMTIAAKQYPNVTRESIRKGLDDIRVFDGIFGKIKYDPASREWEFKLLHGVIQNGATKVID
ncbi:penicillin-binding protein activator [Variovorax sp. M-6]|uniref:ABC transporter substrate-binding protein n=1 Tax=Variovorax sp. M-6 TaxID=3233041 RepID=UPI003F9EB76C